MSTQPARIAEADRVELVYYWALNQLADAIAVDSLHLWTAQVPASQEAAVTGGHYLSSIVSLLTDYRSVAHELAVAYYRLVRALRTGSTVAYGSDHAGQQVGLNDLRDAFDEIVSHVESEVHGSVTNGDPESSYNTTEPNLNLGTADDLIEVEYVYDIDELIAQANHDAIDEAGINIDALGVESLVKQIGEIKHDSKDPQGQATAAHQSAGSRQAAAAQRIMLNAARGLVYDLAESDRLIIGWVRYSQTGHPCGWCAMLISRGVVYKTRAQAGGELANGEIKTGQAPADQDRYHDNCRCVAVPVFSLEQFNTSSLFDANRYFDELWQELKQLSADERVRQYGTTDLLAIFRKLMRTAPAAPAQAAA